MEKKKWSEAMQRHDPGVQFSPEMTAEWTAFCGRPSDSEEPPDTGSRAVQQRARGDLAPQLYDFAWRVDSQAMDSNMHVLIERARGRQALPRDLALFNLASAGRLPFAAAGGFLIHRAYPPLTDRKRKMVRAAL